MDKRLSGLAIAAALACTNSSHSAAAQVGPEQVVGQDLVAAVNFVKDDVKADGRLFVPEKVRRVRALIVIAFWGLGPDFYSDPQIRRLVETTDSGLLLVQITKINVTGIDNIPVTENRGYDALGQVLQRLAKESGRPELADAPLLFWGHSRAAHMGPVFAALHPERTIAFVRYHSGAIGDLKVPHEIPALFFTGGRNQTLAPNRIAGEQQAWMSGRAAGAPWTYALEPNAVHGDRDDLVKANTLLIPWIRAVMEQRLSPAGGPLRSMSASAGEQNWLPDEQSAVGWTTVTGRGQ